MSYQIASIFTIMGERVAGMSELKTPQGPQNTHKIYIFFTGLAQTLEKMVYELF